MTDKLIDEVLRHDAEMTKGPWSADLDRPGRGAAVVHSNAIRAGAYPHLHIAHPPSFNRAKQFVANFDGIAYYRTAAPKLARMVQQRDKALKRAMEALRKRIGCSGDGQANIEESALADITKILQEP